MKNLKSCLVVAAIACALLVVGCKKDTQAPKPTLSVSTNLKSTVLYTQADSSGGDKGGNPPRK